MKWLVLTGLLEACYLRMRLLGDLRQHVPETICLLLVSGLFYLFSCRCVVRGEGPGLGVLAGAALLFRLTVWPLYPALSDDVFRYRWEGKIQQAGGNPYFAYPNDPAWTSLRDATFQSVPGRDFRAIYGPLLELGQRLTYSVVSAWEPDPYRQAFWFKLPAALGDLGVLAALGLLLRAHGLDLARLLIYAWSPLAVMEFWGSGHNDSLVLCLILLALLSAARDRWTWAYTALSLATAAKIWPAMLFPFFLRRGGWRPLWVVPLGLGLAALPYWDPRWAALESNARFLSGFLSGWRNNDSLFAILLWAAGGDAYLAKKLAFAVMALAVCAVTLLRWSLERSALAVTALLLMVSANCHAWYLTWMLPLLAVQPVAGLLLWTALTPIGHVPVIAWLATGVWNGSVPSRWLEYAPVYGALAWEAGKRILRFRT